MSKIAYTVTAEFEDAEVLEEFVGWLTGGHLAGVKEGGAEWAGVVRFDREPREMALRVECRYVFPAREAFEAYERDHAPALREEGRARFPPERGVRMTRTVGEFD